MRVSKISIKNILGLESLEIDKPGPWTEITGENGSGKTSCLDAIRAALGSGHDATLLRKGATEGEVVLVLDDETEIKRKVTETDSSVTVNHPEFGKISRPAAFLKKIADPSGLNPVQFLTASKKDRVDQLLQAIPMKVSTSQLLFVPVVAMAGVNLEDHALTVIGKIARSIFDLRTGMNRSEKDKRATVRQMSEGLPEEAPEGNWGDVLTDASAEFQNLQKTVSATVQAIDREASETKAAAKSECDAHIAAVKNELEKAIERLRADAEIEINQTLEGYEEASQKAEAHRLEQRAAAESDYRPKEASLKEKIGHAKAMVEQHAKAESTREFIAQLTGEANTLEAEAAKLTHALGQLEILKSNLLDKLPIKDLSVQDGDIYVGGIPFDRVNEAARIDLAIEIATLHSGPLGLVAVDGLERLDPKTFALFKEKAAKTNLQFVISRVSDGPLQISTENREVA